MELKRIFVNDDTAEGLYTMIYDGGVVDEYERLFSLWDNTEYVRSYLVQNKAYTNTPYFTGATLDDLVTKILKEAEELEYLIEEHSFEENKKLEMLFRPLKDQEYKLPTFQHTKAKIDNRKYFPKPLIRVYGLRIAENTFVVTGGAIKLVKRMIDHPDTEKELEKFEIAKQFLKKNGFSSEDDFKIWINE